MSNGCRQQKRTPEIGYNLGKSNQNGTLESNIDTNKQDNQQNQNGCQDKRDPPTRTGEQEGN